MNESTARAHVIEALVKQFGRYTKRATIEESVWAGDPYGWSSSAICTITSENGLPGVDYDLEGWIQLNNHLAPHKLFAEAINSAVTGVYYQGE